jgi:hypothetical protein
MFGFWPQDFKSCGACQDPDRARSLNMKDQSVAPFPFIVGPKGPLAQRIEFNFGFFAKRELFQAQHKILVHSFQFVHDLPGGFGMYKVQLYER